jgi:hypothetical protein
MAGLAIRGWNRVKYISNTKNPAGRPGFVVELHEQLATAYPAECRIIGRRARDVMPAAARALVSTVAV